MLISLNLINKDNKMKRNKYVNIIYNKKSNGKVSIYIKTLINAFKIK